MKKIALSAAVLASLLSFNANANTYVGGSVGMQDVTASPSYYRGIRPGLFIGYGGMYDTDFYMAGELSGSLVSTLTDDYEVRNQSLRISPNFGLSFIPGAMLAQASMGFLRLGGAYGYFADANTWRWGAIFGAGLETAFTPCWSVRAEYDYTVYRSMPVGTPRSDEFVVSLKYTFDA